MADLETQTSAQTIGQEHILMNSDAMRNHTTVISRAAAMRDIMLQHEKTFKEQVRDLHKLYEVQRLLMQKSSEEVPKHIMRVSGSSNVLEQKRQETSLLENQTILIDMYGWVNSCKERKKHFEENPSSKSSPTKKKTIDLEKLPDDDTDDEVEKSETLSATLKMSIGKEHMTRFIEHQSLIGGSSDSLGSALMKELPQVHSDQDASVAFHSGYTSIGNGPLINFSQLHNVSKVSLVGAKTAYHTDLSKNIFAEDNSCGYFQGSKENVTPSLLSLQQFGSPKIYDGFLPPLAQNVYATSLVGNVRDGTTDTELQHFLDASKDGWYPSTQMQKNAATSSVEMERVSGGQITWDMLNSISSDKACIDHNENTGQSQTILRQNPSPVSHLTVFQQQRTRSPPSLASVRKHGSLFQSTTQATHGNMSAPVLLGMQSAASNHTFSRPWNMFGFEHTNPNVPLVTPYKKPPKLMMPNDGTHVELKVASLQDEPSVVTSQGICFSDAPDEEAANLVQDREMKKEAGESLWKVTRMHMQCNDNPQISGSASSMCNDMRKGEDVHMERSMKLDGRPHIECQSVIHQGRSEYNHLNQIKEIQLEEQSFLCIRECARGDMHSAKTCHMRVGNVYGGDEGPDSNMGHNENEHLICPAKNVSAEDINSTEVSTFIGDCKDDGTLGNTRDSPQASYSIVSLKSMDDVCVKSITLGNTINHTEKQSYVTCGAADLDTQVLSMQCTNAVVMKEEVGDSSKLMAYKVSLSCIENLESPLKVGNGSQFVYTGDMDAADSDHLAASILLSFTPQSQKRGYDGDMQHKSKESKHADAQSKKHTEHRGAFNEDMKRKGHMEARKGLKKVKCIKDQSSEVLSDNEAPIKVQLSRSSSSSRKVMVKTMNAGAHSSQRVTENILTKFGSDTKSHRGRRTLRGHANEGIMRSKHHNEEGDFGYAKKIEGLTRGGSRAEDDTEECSSKVGNTAYPDSCLPSPVYFRKDEEHSNLNKASTRIRRKGWDHSARKTGRARSQT